MKKVIHYKHTNIAQAPDELSKCINKYSSTYVSEVCGYGNSPTIPAGAAVYHLHNKDANTPSGKKIIQYHSEPYMVDLSPKQISKQLVISQYHATLPEFRNFENVRNVIDFIVPEYDIHKCENKIRIGYSPSRTRKLGAWHDKGYDQTVKILNLIKSKFPNLVEIDIILGVPLAECIQRKSKCNIIIDECVTSSYHRSGLEGLALGKVTICSFSPEVEKVFLQSAQAQINPFVNVWIDRLEKKLLELIELGPEWLYSEGCQNRLWMESYWNPEDIVAEFTKIYDSL